MKGSFGMNRMQKIVLGIGAVVAIVMGVFPPWTYTCDSESVHRMRPAGYAPIVSPPPPEKDFMAFGVQIDGRRLAVQWAIVAMATGVGVVVLHRPAESRSVRAEDHERDA